MSIAIIYVSISKKSKVPFIKEICSISHITPKHIAIIAEDGVLQSVLSVNKSEYAHIKSAM